VERRHERSGGGKRGDSRVGRLTIGAQVGSHVANLLHGWALGWVHGLVVIGSGGDRNDEA